jgi:hypothetical protein
MYAVRLRRLDFGQRIGVVDADHTQFNSAQSHLFAKFVRNWAHWPAWCRAAN